MSAESTVSRNYLDWLLAMPWKKKSKEIRELKVAEETLEADHYGLVAEKIKANAFSKFQPRLRRIRFRWKTPKASILLFCRTSRSGQDFRLGSRSRKRQGASLFACRFGGVRDEAEIKGHRRTYIGAMPGQILQMMKKAGTRNPVFMLDEIDKMPTDFRGAIRLRHFRKCSTPEQELHVRRSLSRCRIRFSRRYFPSSLRQTCFHDDSRAVAGPYGSDPALRVIPRLEKLEIAKRFLVRKQMEATGLNGKQIEFADEGISAVIQGYTRESGVRNLEREVGNVARKVARKIVSKEGKELGKVTVNADKVAELLGPAKFRDTTTDRRNEIGATTGRA